MKVQRESFEDFLERIQPMIAEMRAHRERMEEICAERDRLYKQMDEIEQRFAQRKLAERHEQENSHN